MTSLDILLVFLGTGRSFSQNRSRELAPSTAASIFVTFEQKSMRASSRYFGMKFLLLEIQFKAKKS